MNKPRVITQIVADTLTAEKAVRRITFDSLAEATGISLSQLKRYFKGTRSMTTDDFEGICDALGLDPFEVFAEASRRRKRNS